MFYKKERGFTLVELLIVIIIVGILAALALPQFNKTKEHAIGKEAVANLKLIAAAEKIYRMETNFYYPYLVVGGASCGDIEPYDCSPINTSLKLSLTGRNWDYTINSPTTSSFTITGDRRGSGAYLDCQYSLAYNDADGEPDPNASCP